jgi:DNA mismatch repair protein PMS2
MYAIDVRFKNQGLDSIEVQDNGDGISPQNYETVALKHYTSKLSTYSDLTTLQTFGFRGEALSSLCALSRFSIVTCTKSDAPKGTKLDFEISGKLKGSSTVAAQKGTTVSVENLFHNLPVRRRELERNIKREWNRVTGVLGQYACIQTGIKFSVSQQPAKGKKTTLFSTKGNQTTRENIVNVFGAKTLAALVALDLNLELEPTSVPSQRWSTQEDGGKKNIRIVGHISRPASGEGRQTPDRQMFFVNARPCALPQVAKAFNEVYKSYNSSQSPFIFANIELDTHLYDVNVSPDKRTILLHDQTRMLENLKTALIELFESQDYTVPISQLPAQKQPSYKQLTISRESTTISRDRTQTPKTPRESTDEDDSEDSSSASSSEGVEDQSSRMPINSKATSAVSRDSLNRDTKAVSLISNWLGKKAENRSDHKAQVPKDATEAAQGLSKEKRRLIEKLGKRQEQTDLLDDTSEVESPATTTRLLLPTTSSDEQATKLQQRKDADRQVSTREDSESPIPALQSPPKPSPGVLNVFSSSVRPRRGSAELATITIGDHTVTSSIGTPCPKRSSVGYTPKTVPRTTRPETSGTSLPSFGSRLSQRFAAPGIQPLSAPSQEESESESEAQGDHQSPESGKSPVESETAASIEDENSQPTLTQSLAKEESQSCASGPGTEEDAGYIDEDEKKAKEEAKVQEMIKAAEESALQPSQENEMRANALLKGTKKKKDLTVNLVKSLSTTPSEISELLCGMDEALSKYCQSTVIDPDKSTMDSEEAEEKLSLTISKSDFAKMKVIGQFNLGFILATRAAEPGSESTGDELFIIDQHASDEKYNFERLQATTILQFQKLVVPKVLELTALEEEIVIENKMALESNGFIIKVDQSGEAPVGSRCQVISLPLSRETTFDLTDLDELLALLAEHPSGSIPRPSKVRKMFAMRACRSSIMIGKNLTHQQMGKVVKHLGELDKPWNCPHGRPTMRHICGLGAWDGVSWKEGDSFEGERAGPTDWTSYVTQNRRDSAQGGSDIESP